MREVYTTPTEMQAAFRRASPAEREQILAFIKVNARPRGQYWFLTQYQDLDTGRKRLTAAFSLDKREGVTGTAIRQTFKLAKWYDEETEPCPKMVKARKGTVLTSDYKRRPAGEFSLGESKAANKTATPKGGRAITLRRKK